MSVKFATPKYRDTAISGWTFALLTHSVVKVHNTSNTRTQNFQGGGSRYKLIVSLKLARPTMQRCRITGWTFALQTCSDCSVVNFHNAFQVRNACNTKIQSFQGGRSRYKLLVSLNLTTPTIQRYRNFRMDVCVTYCVFTVHSAYNTSIEKLQGGRSRYKLVVALTFTTPTIQRHSNFRVGVRVANL